MASNSFSPGPPHADVFLPAPGRESEAAPAAVEALENRAEQLLHEHFGPSEREGSVAHAPGPLDVQGDHTHYSHGFALQLLMHHGIAVASRPSHEAHSRVVFEGDEDPWHFSSAAGESPENAPTWVRVVAHITQAVTPASPVDLAVVSTVPAICRDAYWAALAVALDRALHALPEQAMFSGEPNARTALSLAQLCEAVQKGSGYPFSMAPLITAREAVPGSFALVDTMTQESLPVETEAGRRLRWVVLDPGEGPPRDTGFHRTRKAEAEEALAWLQSRSFAELRAFRDLEHRDLQRAADELPPELRPIARHIVTENRRVQRLVAAMRRADWQMIGAILLMSHASTREQWGGTSEAADALVAQAKSHMLDGLYGAGMTGRGGYVLVVGQPVAVPASLERMAAAFEKRFERSLRIMSP